MTVSIARPEPVQNEGLSEGAARAWVEGAQRGESVACDALVREHARLVASVARQWTANAADVEDLTQEIFLKVFRALDRCDPARPFVPWLYEIALNTCRDFARRRRGIALDAPADVAAAPVGEVREELMRAVADGLDELSPNEALVVRLRGMEGLSTAEVAARLGCSAETVRSHWCRALPKLRDRLRTQGWVD